jgi:hypothetical protein
MAVALLTGALCTFSVLITLRKFSFIQGCQWRWTAHEVEKVCASTAANGVVARTA